MVNMEEEAGQRARVGERIDCAIMMRSGGGSVESASKASALIFLLTIPLGAWIRAWNYC